MPGLTMREGYTVSTATVDDIAMCRSLQDGVQSKFSVAMPHSDDCWRWLLSHASSSQIYVRNGSGDPVALARVYADDGSVDMGEIAASDQAATTALLAHALSLTSADGTARVCVRPHVPGLAEQTQDAERPDWYYVRIEEPAALFTTIAAELLGRLSGSDVAPGDALISFWGSHLRLHWDAAQLTVEAGGPMQAPISSGGSGLPMDALGSLLFGGGAESLEDRFADAFLGRQSDLMHTLFPPQAADLLTFYLPS
jgi:hypothetical protein